MLEERFLYGLLAQTGHGDLPHCVLGTLHRLTILSESELSYSPRHRQCTDRPGMVCRHALPPLA